MYKEPEEGIGGGCTRGEVFFEYGKEERDDAHPALDRGSDACGCSVGKVSAREL